MSTPEPTPEEARSALEQAARAEAPIRSEDRLFAVRLYGLAATVILLSIVIVFLSSLPAWTGPLQGALAGLGMAAALLLTVAAQRRQHAFTRAGSRLFVATLLFWIVWAGLVWQVSLHSDWLGFTQPRAARDLHFVLMAIVGVVPLLAAAVVFRFRR